MRHFRYKPIFLFIIPVLSLIFPSAVLPEISQEEIEKADTGPMVIKSDILEIDNKRGIVIFSGNVDARRGGFIINSRKLVLYYYNQQGEKEQGTENIKTDKIIATGKVRITRTDGGLAMAEKAVYYQNDEKVVLTGKPVVKRGNDFVEGSKITLFLKEKRSIVEGAGDKKARAVLFPRSKKR